MAQSSSPGSDPDISIERLSASIGKLQLPKLSMAPRPPETYMAPSLDDTWDPAPVQNGSETGKYSSNGSEEVDMERGYWKKLETVEVGLITEKEGWFLQKYKIESDVSQLDLGVLGQWLNGSRPTETRSSRIGVSTLFGLCMAIGLSGQALRTCVV